MPFAGEKIIYYPTCSSTNTMAMQLIAISQIPAGTIVITDFQSQGRGQRGNTWVSEPYQNLTFSLILYPIWMNAQDSFYLYMLTALGIYKTLNSLIRKELSIKWPNDIYFQDKKLGGILIENIVNKSKLKAAVIGIGLNVNQTKFNNCPHATSLSLLYAHKFNLSWLLLQLTKNIQRQYNRLYQEGIHGLQKDYLQYLYGFHKTSIFKDKEGIFQGMIQGIDEYGRLMVHRTSQECRHYTNQEITFIM